MAIEQCGIYWADLDPVRGREQRGRRPVLVISKDLLNNLPLTVLVMIGTSADRLTAGERYASDVWVTAQESGLPKDTVFLGIQIRSIDPSRIGDRIGELPAERLQEVWDAVRYVMGDSR